MKLPAWLAAFRWKSVPPAVQSQGEKYEQLKERSAQLKTELLGLRERLDNLREARRRLMSRASRADGAIASMGLLRRLLTRAGSKEYGELLEMRDKISAGLKENEQLTEDSLKLMRGLATEINEVRRMRNRVLIELFRSVEAAQEGEHCPVSESIAEKFPRAFEHALNGEMEKQFNEWRRTLATSKGPSGKLERSISFEELDFRAQDLRDQAKRIASAAVELLASDIEESRKQFMKEMQSLVKYEFSDLENDPRLGDMLGKLYQSAYKNAQGEAEDLVSEELRRHQIDQIVTKMLKS